tara:strand:- start:63 stop:356 length:294 start_codon:yes stop_codon:yes gene_type:complete
MQALKEGKFKGLPTIYARSDSFGKGGLGLRQAGDRIGIGTDGTRDSKQGEGRNEDDGFPGEVDTDGGWREEQEADVLESYASEYVHFMSIYLLFSVF